MEEFDLILTENPSLYNTELRRYVRELANHVMHVCNSASTELLKINIHFLIKSTSTFKMNVCIKSESTMRKFKNDA